MLKGLKYFIPLISLCFFLVSVHSYNVYSLDTLSAQASFEEGMRLQNEGYLLEAERQFKNAIDLEPANPNYHFQLANIYAIRHDRLVAAGSQDIARRVLRNTASELEQTVMLRPDDIAAHYNLGVVYKRQRRFEAAREQFRKVLTLDPSSVNAMMQIGASYEEQGFFDEAKDAYTKAKELDYNNPGIQVALEDLKEHRKQAHEQMLAERTQSRMARRRTRFPYSPYGQPHTYQAEAMQANQDIRQILPYLGAMLVQQFLKKRTSFEFEEYE